MQEQEKEELKEETEAKPSDGKQQMPQEDGTAQSEAVLNMYKRKKRKGKFVSTLDDKTASALQKKKSLFMYISTLLFAISLFLEVEGRQKLADNKPLIAVFSLYVIGLVTLIALTVFISLMNRTRQKIGREIRECDSPRAGFEHLTFISYEFFNALHVIIACAEIAVSVYKFGVWGGINIVVSVASAVTCFISRQILFKANAGNLEYVPEDESQNKKPS